MDVITDPQVFDGGYLPRRLEHRNAELKTLLRRWEAVTWDDEAEHVLIHGPSGVGKTVLTRIALRRLERRATVDRAHVRCLGLSTAGVLRSTLQGLGESPDETTPTEDLAVQLRERVDRPTIVVLDEADDLPSTDALSRLTEIPDLSVAPICHDHEEFLASVSKHVRERLQTGQLPLNRYGVDELADILDARARAGLSGSWTRSHLEAIANESAGRARRAIQSLRAAAEISEERGTSLPDIPVDDAYERAMGRVRRANLKSLPFHHHVLYELIRDAGKISSGELYDRYELVADDVYRGQPTPPLGEKARRNKLVKLDEYELIDCAENRHDTNVVLDERVASDVVKPARLLAQ